jgi:5-methyltetrahydrofolate--homocysteine methyltransferase
MDLSNFIVVGENIHCTRVVKSGGSRTKPVNGGEGVSFKYKGESRILPVPENWAEASPNYAQGKIQHVQLAIYQALNGTGEERQTAVDYLCWAAERQIRKGAKFLDVNVDEYSSEKSAVIEVMKWLSSFLSERYDTPLSIDSSNVDALVAGLENCRKGTTPMVNSISLERQDAVDVVMQFNADAIVSPASKTELPADASGKIDNLKKIIEILDGAGMDRTKMHLDPLVFPISVDSNNGKNFLQAVAEAKKRFEGVNISGGLSNVSFGMPNRKLLNQVFTWLFVEAGGNGGIIDPVQMSPEDVGSLDPEDEKFKYARAVLEGTDMFGAEYIAAHREGLL